MKDLKKAMRAVNEQESAETERPALAVTNPVNVAPESARVAEIRRNLDARPVARLKRLEEQFNKSLTASKAEIVDIEADRDARLENIDFAIDVERKLFQGQIDDNERERKERLEQIEQDRRAAIEGFDKRDADLKAERDTCLQSMKQQRQGIEDEAAEQLAALETMMNMARGGLQGAGAVEGSKS